MTLAVWVGVAVLGGFGSIARFLLDGAVTARAGGGFPYGTFAVNASGAFLLGLVAGAALSRDAHLLAGTATIGAFTTFSTWVFETHRLGEEGNGGRAAANVLVSLAVGIGGAALGHLLGGRL